jgi:hypothetical protein
MALDCRSEEQTVKAKNSKIKKVDQAKPGSIHSPLGADKNMTGIEK